MAENSNVPIPVVDAPMLAETELRHSLADGIYELSFPPDWGGAEFGKYRVQTLFVPVHVVTSKFLLYGGIQVFSRDDEGDPEDMLSTLEAGGARSEFFCRHCHDLLLEPSITTTGAVRKCRRCAIPEMAEPLQVIRFSVTKVRLAAKLYELFRMLGSNADIEIFRFKEWGPAQGTTMTPSVEAMIGRMWTDADHAVYSCGRLHRDLSTGADGIAVIGGFVGA